MNAYLLSSGWSDFPLCWDCRRAPGRRPSPRTALRYWQGLERTGSGVWSGTSAYSPPLEVRSTGRRLCRRKKHFLKILTRTEWSRPFVLLNWSSLEKDLYIKFLYRKYLNLKYYIKEIIIKILAIIEILNLGNVSEFYPYGQNFMICRVMI